MRAGNTERSWGWVARLLHWTIAALILLQLGLGVWMANFVPDLIAQFRLVQIHKSFGFLVFALALVRVLWRVVNRAHPVMPAGTPRWQVRAATASHVLLYALMFVLPLSGWIMASASPVQDLLGIDNMVFGWFAMPDPFVPGVKAVETAAWQVHVASAVVMALVLAVHAGAALKHHLVDGDDVLARMTWAK
jgi:cytochrome b561